jgi:hypothetical protein
MIEAGEPTNQWVLHAQRSAFKDQFAVFLQASGEAREVDQDGHRQT